MHKKQQQSLTIKSKWGSRSSKRFSGGGGGEEGIGSVGICSEGDVKGDVKEVKKGFVEKGQCE